MNKPGQPTAKQDLLQAHEVLLILRAPPPAPAPVPGQPLSVASNPLEGDEVLLAVWPDGTATGLHGHVDLGTGLRTALSQLIAEELDVSMSQVSLIMGNTAAAPNQGPTIASASIQIHGAVLRQAAAQAREYLLIQASQRLQRPVDQLTVTAGVITCSEDPSLRLSYGELVSGVQVLLQLDPSVKLKNVSEHRVIGQSVPRVDIPAKVTGELTFVHDMRVPGMLHGRVVRPPYAGADHGDFIGNTLESVDESSIAHIPGIVAVVVIRDFVGVVAEREEQAQAALESLRVKWKDWPGLPDVSNLENALRDNPAVPREVVNEGDAAGMIDQSASSMSRTYIWPYQMHASLGPSCAVADWRADASQAADAFRLRVWAGTQNPHVLRADLARLTGIQDIEVDVVRMEASGCYGRNGADDVAADAVLLSRAVGAPVRVQLTREQENLWEPKGAAQWMDVKGALSSDGGINAWDFATSYPSNGAPTLALLLTRTIEPVAQAYAMGDRTSRPPYTVPNLRVTVNDMPPILRASWLRGVSALPNSFAHESFVDELAMAAGQDPVQYRLRHLEDPRASELLQATAERAGWESRTSPRKTLGENGLLQGQGVAYARYIHSRWPGFGAAWAAWVANVEVNPRTGEVHVRKVVVGHDAGLTVNPAGVEHQVHGNVLQTTSRALHEKVGTEPVKNTVSSQEWGSYPVLSFRQVPVIEVYQMPRPEEPPLGAGESASVPGTAAIANAIFDATGVRFRQPPFTPEVVRAALNPLPQPEEDVTPSADPVRRLQSLSAQAVFPRRKGFWWRALAVSVGAVGALAGVLGMRGAIAPVTRPDPGLYAPETIERGRRLAALGNCATCHTSADGQRYAGGVGLQTPFGVIYSTNITPDSQTGIGAWSLAAFERAMRQGISRDGSHLFPAFPYTAFSRLTDDDVTSLYAYFMAQTPVQQVNPETSLKFPYGVRPLMSVWNALYPPAAAPATVPSEVDSTAWLRGEYLVNGPAHCSACHSPRDAAGAEKLGQRFLSGGYVKGWQAHDLTASSPSPVPWTEAAFYDYLRRGVSDNHGAALGPMAHVVRQLNAVPDEDIKAMAVYLASFQNEVPAQVVKQVAAEQIARTAQPAPALFGSSHRLFQSACAACHHEGSGPTLLGANVPLGLNTNLHASEPDNLIRIILEGVRTPPSQEVGFMGGFADQFNDSQMVGLVDYLRARFAPQQPAWASVDKAVKRMRLAVDQAQKLP